MDTHFIPEIMRWYLCTKTVPTLGNPRILRVPVPTQYFLCVHWENTHIIRGFSQCTYRQSLNWCIPCITQDTVTTTAWKTRAVKVCLWNEIFWSWISFGELFLEHDFEGFRELDFYLVGRGTVPRQVLCTYALYCTVGTGTYGILTWHRTRTYRLRYLLDDQGFFSILLVILINYQQVINK